ncbi:tRNA lysidine(34) synthetase TilS [Melittangium boletus]|uniref:tRNA(Ile)-lysidine synthase n=1 Tax=Melittangium boletus DSM 14713 TaxID=1294270 RepID=A0A250IT13_9BACT|nr:tRNA lysidine(34) synthetase TilS [Melittangium boletus]ATB34291.1 tRNA(Ile)-lysidine synthetase [Melittangium boletus DSM 14713]
MGDASHLFSNTLQGAYQQLGRRGGSVLLAVSGGADSSALLVGTARVRQALRLRVEVATLDHGLRPEARREVEAVARLSAQWGLPCHVRALGLMPGAGMEARAREARYTALEALRRELGLDVVATAHTASDQAETLLMRLLRGASLRGAVGIHRARPFLIRPLIERTREEVEAFLAEQDTPFVTDPMNGDPSFLRTRLRAQLLPALSAAVGFPVTPHLAAFTRVAAEDEALLSKLADGAWSRLVLADGSLDAVGVRALERPLRRRVLARLLSEADAEVDGPSLARVMDAVDSGGTVTLRGGGGVRGSLQLRAMGGRVRCVRRGERAPEATPPVWLREEEGHVLQEGTGWTFGVRRAAPPVGVLGMPVPRQARWPLLVRTRREGDRVRGPAGSRKLQDVLVDSRVPSERRDALPVVTDADGTLLWVPGIWNSTVPSEVRLFLWAIPPGASMPGVLPL